MGGKHWTEERANALFLEAGFQPLEPFRNTKFKRLCKHNECGNEVEVIFDVLRRGGNPCGFCSGRLLDMKEVHDKLRAVGLKPLSEYKSSGEPWECEHLPCGRKVSPSWDQIQQGKGGCGYCAGTRVDTSEQKKILELNELEPLETYRNSQTPWMCLHKPCGRIVYPRWKSLKSGNGGCVHCSGIGKLDPDEASAFFKSKNLIPQVPYVNAITPWPSIHVPCGREVSPAYSYIQSGSSGCEYCSGNLPIDQDTAVKNFKLLNLSPLEPFVSTGTPWKSIHTICGREVSPQYSNVVSSKQGPCKFCAEKGFDYEKPGIFYIITNKNLGAHKVGVTRIEVSRMATHQKHGWETYKTVTFDLGANAHKVEQQVLKWLRDELKLPPYLSHHEMPQAGWTETVSAEEIELLTIWEKVQLLLGEINE